MPSTIYLTTTIQEPKSKVRQAIIEAVEIYKDNIISINEDFLEGNINFNIELKNNVFLAPISRILLTIEIQDFPINFFSYLKVNIQYDLNESGWQSRLENNFFIRPSIKKNSKDTLSIFKRKIEA